MIAITPQGRRSWCTDDDLKLPMEERTYWEIEDLSERDRVRLSDSTVIDPMTGKESHGIGTQIYLTLKAGLKGITEGSKFPDADGNAVPFEADEDTGEVTDTFLRRISLGYQSKIYLAILTSAVMEEEEKEL